MSSLHRNLPVATRAEPAQHSAATKAPPPANWSARGPIMLGLIALCILVLGFGGWSTFSSIAGAVVASGQIEVEDRRQVVQHPDGGVVAKILVRDGDSVEAGDVLMVLDGAMLHSELNIVEGQLFELLARRGRLEAERDQGTTISFPEEIITRAETDRSVADLLEGQRQLFAARAENLNQEDAQLARRAEQAGSQVDGIDAQLEATQRQSELIEKELVDMRALRAKGLAQEARVLALERQAASLAGTAGELIATRAETEGRITEIGIERARLISGRREQAETELRDLGYRVLELAERRRSLSEQISRLEIRAPSSGQVLSLQVSTPRAVLRAAEPVLYVVPQDRPLVITAQISPRHIDEVRVGQPVELRFSSLPSRSTPALEGIVKTVSADALTDDRTGATYYRAEIGLNAGELAKLGDQALIPGMPVETFLQTGERSPLAYLLKPFTDYFNRAFRES